MRKFFTLLIPLCIAILTLAGCYTILKHPEVQENYTSTDYQHDCVRCHADYQEYPYGYFYGDYPDYWWSAPRWGHYYAYPWWWDNYWYDQEDIDHSQQDNSPRPDAGEKAVRRNSLRPPYSTELQSPGVPSISPQQPGGSQPGTVGGKANPPESATDDKKKDEQKKEEKKESKKAERRSGGGKR